MNDTYAPGHEWMWFVFDGEDSWPIRYNGASEKEALAAYLRLSGKTSLPDGWHIWHGSRRRPELIIIR